MKSSQMTKTSTELEWRALLEKRAGLPSFTCQGSLGAWGSRQKAVEANKPKGLTSRLAAPSPNSTFCSIATPRNMSSSKSSPHHCNFNAQTNSSLNFTKKALLGEDVKQPETRTRRNDIADKILSSSGSQANQRISRPSSFSTTTHPTPTSPSPSSFSTTIEAASNIRPAVHKRERGGGSSNARYVFHI